MIDGSFIFPELPYLFIHYIYNKPIQKNRHSSTITQNPLQILGSANANSLIYWTSLNINYPNVHQRWNNYIVIDLPN